MTPLLRLADRLAAWAGYGLCTLAALGWLYGAWRMALNWAGGGE